MSPPIVHYLNRTCIELATTNLTFFDSAAGGNLSTCAIDPPKFDRKGWTLGSIAMCLATAKALLVFFRFALLILGRYIKDTMYTNLRNLPSHQLHLELEESYAENLSKKDRKAFNDGRSETGRYSNVVFSTNEFTRKRTVVIVENLNDEPRNVVRGTDQWKGRRATEVASLNIPELRNRRARAIMPMEVDTTATVVAPQPALLAESSNEGQGANEGAPEISGNPPAYQYTWRSFV